MRLSTGLILPVLISTASAIDATVYIFQGEDFPNASAPPTLFPEEARLVLAQRLGVSQYHGLGDASESTLSYINKFGGPQETLFHHAKDKAAELVLIVEGVSSKSAEPLLSAWSSFKPAFTISNPPSSSSTLKLAQELQVQLGKKTPSCSIADAINPFDRNCWNGKSKIMQIDLASKTGSGIDDLMSAQERLISFAKDQEMNVVVVLMPEACRTVKSSPKPYGSYEMPQAALSRRQQAEEVMTVDSAATPSAPATQSKQVQVSNTTGEPQQLLPVPPSCYTSLNDCNNKTNTCSGHGECYRKWGSEGKPSCFACNCIPEWVYFNEGNNSAKPYKRIDYWGGGACQKRDVSGPFWLISIFTVVLIGVVSWAIGMMFAIGEEKLPGVIGAGVSNKAR